MKGEKRWIHLISENDTEVTFWIPPWKEWRTMLRDEDRFKWSLFKIHDEKPEGVLEWDCIKNLSRYL